MRNHSNPQAPQKSQKCNLVNHPIQLLFEGNTSQILLLSDRENSNACLVMLR